MWSTLPDELVQRVAFFAERDGSALRWCSACRYFHTAQPDVRLLLLGDLATIVTDPMMEESITSVCVLEDLAVNLPVACADGAYQRLATLPSHLLDRLTHLFVAAPLRPGALEPVPFVSMPRLHTLHIQHADIGEGDVEGTRSEEYGEACNKALKLVQALVPLSRTSFRRLSIDLPLGHDAENAANGHVQIRDRQSGQWRTHNPLNDLAAMIGSNHIQFLALNLGCWDPPALGNKIKQLIDRHCSTLLEPPTISTYLRLQLRDASTRAY